MKATMDRIFTYETDDLRQLVVDDVNRRYGLSLHLRDVIFDSGDDIPF